MKPKTVIFLIAVLVICIGYVAVRHGGWFGEADNGDENGKAKAKSLFAPAPAAGARLEITAQDEARIVFQKTGDDWRILEPISAKAEADEVTKVTDALAGLRGAKVKDDDDELTGLDKPQWTVTFVDSEAQTYTVRVGNARPGYEDEFYVRIGDGEQVYLAEANLEALLSKPVGDYRDKTILSISADQVASVEVVGAKSFKLERRGEDAWTLLADKLTAPADKEKVTELIEKFSSLSTDKFVKDDPADLAGYGLDKGREQMVLRVTMKPPTPPAPASKPATAPATKPATKPTTKPAPEPKVHVVRLGGQPASDTDKVFARIDGEPAVFLLDQALMKDLQPKLLDLRDKKILTLDKDMITRVELSTPAGAADLQKDQAGKWQMLKPYAGPANRDTVEQLVSSVNDLKAERFIDSAALAGQGLGPQAGKITFHLKDKTKATLLVGKKDPAGEVYVKTAEAKGVALVSAEKVQLLPTAPAGFWPGELWKKPAGELVVGLEVTQPGPKGTVRLKRGKFGIWSMVQPAGGEADRASASKITNAITKLSATKVVALGPSVPAKYAKPEGGRLITVRLTTREMPSAMGRRYPPRPPVGPVGTAQLIKPTTKPATKPTTAPTTAPAMKPATKPATKPAPTPAPQPAATRPATKPATRPATKPAVKPATRPATTKPAPILHTYTFKVVRIGDNCYAWVEGPKITAVGEFPKSLWDDLTAELRGKTVLNSKCSRTQAPGGTRRRPPRLSTPRRSPTSSAT